MVGVPFNSLISEVYLPHFNKYGEEGLKTLCNLTVSKMAFLAAYRDCDPIEKLPEKEKKDLKQYVNDLFPDKTVEEKVEAAKVIHAIGNLL